MNCNHNNSYHISTDNTITTWQDIIGDVKKNKVMAQLLRDVLKKVDKEDGKALIPVDELLRLRDLHNYDDTAVKAQISNIQELLDNLDLPGMRSELYTLQLAIYDADQEIARHTQELEAQAARIAEQERKNAEQAQILEAHDEELGEHAEAISEITEELDEHAQDLAEHSQTLEEHAEEIADIKEELENVAKIEDIPTKVSQLENDEEFITEADVPTKVSELENDLDFITEADIPTKVSDLENDLNFVDGAHLEQVVEAKVDSAVEAINPLIFEDLDN